MLETENYCNSLFAGLPKSRLSSLQSVLNAAARLIGRFPRFSHITSFMTDVLHWLPVPSRIQYKILLLVSRTQQGMAPKYLCDLMRKPLSSLSSRPLRSSDRLDLLVPRARTSMAQHRAFAILGPSLWNDLPPSLRSKISLGISPSSLRCLKTFLFPQGCHAGSASE